VLLDNGSQVNVVDFRLLGLSDASADNVNIIGLGTRSNASGTLQGVEHSLRAAVGYRPFTTDNLAGQVDLLAITFADVQMDCCRRNSGGIAKPSGALGRRLALYTKPVADPVNAAVGPNMPLTAEIGPVIDGNIE
jgi:hypothetical protein